MKKSFLILLCCFVAAFLAGCGGWLAKKQAERGKETAATTNKPTYLPIDSLIKSKQVENGHTSITFDTTKCAQYPPDFTPENIFTKPEYKALFGWTDDYALEPNPTSYRRRLMYKNVPFHGSAFGYHARDCISWAQGSKFIPEHEPSEVRISLDEARQIALAEEYPTLIQEKRKKVMDIFGYIPEKYREMVTETPMQEDEKKSYLPNAKFAWEKLKPLASDSIYYPKGELIYLENITPVSSLYYKFEIYAIGGSWYVFINAMDGKISKGRQDPHLTCEPSNPTAQTADYLWYYNSLSPMSTIDVSACDFGTCDQYRFTDGQINAFCQEGTFSSLNLTPHKSFVDWSGNNEHYSPNISMGAITLPSTVSNADGAATIALTPATGVPATSYTYSGSQIISTNGLASSTIGTTASGANVANLSAGIYELAITSNNGCAYTEYVAIGYQAGTAVTASIPQVADCYNKEGNIHLSIDNAGSFGGQNPQVLIKGAINTNGFMTFSDFEIIANKFEFNLSQLNVGARPLPPGNYAILVRNPSNNAMTGVNIRLDYPPCEVERKLLQTAHWAVQRTHQLFKGNATAINGGTNINLVLPSDIVSPEATDPLPDDGINQFSHSPKPIGIGIVNDVVNNASFVTSSTNSDERLMKICKGSNPNFPMVALDILAHEYAHGINVAGVNVATNGISSISPEADAINEGFSDIMGCVIEANTRPIAGCWSIGGDLPTTVFLARNIANPNSQQMPSTYQGDYWNVTLEQELIHGLEYIHSRVFSYWFYLLSQGGEQTVGGTTYEVPALGIDVAAKITLAAFVNNEYGLNNGTNKNYPGLCRATTKAAHALYPPTGGVCSPEVIAVRDAWRAVGIDCWSSITPALCEACAPTAPDNSVCDNHLPYLQRLEAGQTH